MRKMNNISFSDYSMTVADAEELMGVSVLPDEFRRKILLNYVWTHGMHELVRLFSAFVGMANSVADNTREQFELYLITECHHHPHLAEKINLPTIQGALEGVTLAQSGNKGMCATCAFRLGTPANQCHTTTLDAKWTSETDEKFMCHEALDPDNEPTKPCAGWAKRHQENFQS